MRILREVLAKDDRIQRATDNYVDDIIVREDIATAEEVIHHLKKFGLDTKPPESLESGRILGLQLKRDDIGDITFHRGNTIPEIEAKMVSRRELFSICGKLLGHYPISGWLRVACSFLKRVSLGDTWDSPVGEVAYKLLTDLLLRVRAEDPVRGKRYVPETKEGRVWCDASSFSIGRFFINPRFDGGRRFVVAQGCRFISYQCRRA